MKILKSLFVLVLSAFVISVSAQDSANPEIQTKLVSFIDLTNQKNYAQAFDLMYPKMFDQVSKQDLIDLMSSMNDEGLSLQIANPKITSYSAPFQDGNETFVRLDYTADMVIDIAPGGMFDHPKPAQGMLEQFEATYGKENVKYSEQEKRYTIMATKAMMAIQQNGEWFLVEINPDQMELMKSLFSEPVLNALVMVK